MKKASILIIDDDPTIHTVLKEALENKGYTVDVSADGKEGLEKALATHPDLIMLDVELPNMRGGMILGKIREDAWGKNVPVIVLSSNENTWSVADIISKGAYEYLLKSDWKLEDIIAKVSKILN